MYLNSRAHPQAIIAEGCHNSPEKESQTLLEFKIFHGPCFLNRDEAEGS